MSTSGLTSPSGRSRSTAPDALARADRAYRRAWWSLALYPVSFVAAFVVGEGLYSLLTDQGASDSWWKALLAGTTAILVFVVPGVLAVANGRAAERHGRIDARWPAMVGAVIGLAFIAVNLLSFLVAQVFG